MKKFIGIVCIAVGVISFFKCMSTWNGQISVLLGYLIGLALISGLPAYYCFRKKDEDDE